MSELCLQAPFGPVLDAVRDGARAWSTAEEIARGAGLDLAEALATILELIALGGLVAWGRWYTLSSESASRMRVQIEDFGLIGRERWVAIDHRGRRGRRRRADVAGDPAPLEELADPRSVDPAGTAAAVEYLDKLCAKLFHLPNPIQNDGLWPPTLILTGPAIVWREAKSPATCWQCEGQVLKPWCLCLCCLRWGMDEHVRRGRRKLTGARSRPRLGIQDRAWFRSVAASLP
jgi:hypothetical protein